MVKTLHYNKSTALRVFDNVQENVIKVLEVKNSLQKMQNSTLLQHNIKKGAILYILDTKNVTNK